MEYLVERQYQSFVLELFVKVIEYRKRWCYHVQRTVEERYQTLLVITMLALNYKLTGNGIQDDQGLIGRWRRLSPIFLECRRRRLTWKPRVLTNRRGHDVR